MRSLSALRSHLARTAGQTPTLLGSLTELPTGVIAASTPEAVQAGSRAFHIQRHLQPQHHLERKWAGHELHQELPCASDARSSPTASELHLVCHPALTAPCRVFTSSSQPQQSFLGRAVKPRVDPFGLVAEELKSVSERLRRTILTDIPILSTAAEYFFKLGSEGKRLRPTILLLMASSLAAGRPRPDMLAVDMRPPAIHVTDHRRRQQRIAEITELIHVASLLHDDVIDSASMRRGLKALNITFGNKVAILAGDFLLARASVSLAALRNSDVIQLLSQVIEDLVSGEIMQMTKSEADLLSMEHYVQKTFFKTASLMANSCQAVAILGGGDEATAQVAYTYGRSLGLAFQFIDDVLDFTGSTSILGKPALNDLASGLATAPVLFAAEEHPDLLPLIARKFSMEGDVAAAQAMVLDSKGIERTREMAADHVAKAIAAIESLPPARSEHAATCRQALIDITQQVLTRTK
mmetsp:Transcript_16159/g.48417  ORF Transcript_16159/g.48417 Transcript_16159/m.48417 type:complete len:467 (-) Transcript_16159:4920-6320(-)